MLALSGPVRCSSGLQLTREGGVRASWGRELRLAPGGWRRSGKPEKRGEEIPAKGSHLLPSSLPLLRLGWYLVASISPGR